jgi:hypothetical protein
MKLHITTQYMENYGAHDWDGQGECPQRWKFKGGEDFFYPLGDAGRGDEAVQELVNHFRPEIEWDDIGSRQYIVGYGVVADDFRTAFERSQLEYEGFIQFPAKVLEMTQEDEYDGQPTEQEEWASFDPDC